MRVSGLKPLLRSGREEGSAGSSEPGSAMSVIVASCANKAGTLASAHDGRMTVLRLVDRGDGAVSFRSLMPCGLKRSSFSPEPDRGVSHADDPPQSPGRRGQ